MGCATDAIAPQSQKGPRVRKLLAVAAKFSAVCALITAIGVLAVGGALAPATTVAAHDYHNAHDYH
jgi:hypothetical protein